jgi:hypothetical protein
MSHHYHVLSNAGALLMSGELFERSFSCHVPLSNARDMNEVIWGNSRALADAACSLRCLIESRRSRRHELADEAHSVTTWRDLYPSSVTRRRHELADAACSVKSRVVYTPSWR